MTEYYFESERDFRDALEFQDEYLECHLASKPRPCWTCGKPTRVGMCATCSASPDPDVTIDAAPTAAEDADAIGGDE